MSAGAILTMLGRMGATRGVPRLVGRLAPRVNSRFPQLAGRGTALGNRVQSTMNARPLGNIPGLRKIANANPTIRGRNVLNPTFRGTQYSLLNPKFGTGLRTLEFPMLAGAFARTEAGRAFDARFRREFEERAPGITGAYDEIFGNDGETADSETTTPPAAGGESSADYSAYEESLRSAGSTAQVNISGLKQQYDGVIEELKNQYKLAETDEEKERIRYIVADVEAQREAGEKAIAEVYASKVQEIQQRSATSRQQTGVSAQEAGDVFRRGASDLRSDVDKSRAGLVAGNRGLGLGGSFESGADPFVNLMSSMAPVSQNYAQRIGDIGSEAIDFMGATTQGQGAAQQADMRRLAMATSSAAQTQHASEVAQRIGTERIALNQQIAALRSQQMSEQSSGRELNAQLSAAERERNAGKFRPNVEALVMAREWGKENPELTYDDYINWHMDTFGVAPGEDARAAYEIGVQERDD